MVSICVKLNELSCGSLVLYGSGIKRIFLGLNKHEVE